MTPAEGFYSVTFQGLAGTGLALLVLKDGQVTGADDGKSTYDGSYSDAPDGAMAVTVTVRVPPGTWLMTGKSAQAEGYEYTISGIWPADLGAGHPIPLTTPFGTVQAVFTRLRGI